jgi:hypothetical protein
MPYVTAGKTIAGMALLEPCRAGMVREWSFPKHPVVMLATERIEELSARKTAVTTAIETLKTKRPARHHPDEIAARLDSVPDLRKALKTASSEQLADIFRAFDVTIDYDKRTQRLNLAATITPELLPRNDDDRSGERSRVPVIARERFVLIGDLSTLVERIFPWPRS